MKSKITLLTCIIFGLSLIRPISVAANEGNEKLFLQKKITELLRDLSELHEVIFSYNSEMLADVHVDYVVDEEEEFEVAINRLFKDTHFRYKVIGSKYVVVFENTREGRKYAREVEQRFKEILLIEKRKQITVLKNHGPIKKVIGKLKAIINMDKTIDGKVTDEDGEALIGVLIRISGKGTGTTTDINGNFEIDITDEDDSILEVSYLGYKTQRIKVDNRDFINIVLEVRSHQLDEVVVTGFQTLNKGRSTGSFAKLGSKELNTLHSENLIDQIDGKLAGVLVNPDGSIVIRGQGSFLGTERLAQNINPGGNATLNQQTGIIFGLRPDLNKPLLVVDGFPIEADISTINPQDIESVTVLKDASALAIWGVRAANGVIVVTTKKPKGAGIKVAFSSFAGINRSPNFSKFHLMSGADMVDWDREVTENWGDLFTGFSGDRAVPDAVQIVADRDNGLISEEEADQMLSELASNDNRQQIEDVFFRNGFYQNHNVSVHHATNKSSTIFSLQYVTDKSPQIGDDINSAIMSFKHNYKPADWLSLEVGYTGSRDDEKQNSRWDDLAGYGNASYSLRTYDKIFDQNGDYTYMFKLTSPLEGQDAANKRLGLSFEEQGYLGWRYNYVEEQELSDTETERIENKVLGRVFIKPHKMVTFESGVELEFNSDNLEITSSPQSFFVRDLINTYTQINAATGQLIYNYPRIGGVRSNYYSTTKNVHVRNSISFDNIFAEKHRLTALVGVEAKAAHFKRDYNTKFAFDESIGPVPVLNLRDLALDRSLTYNERFGVFFDADLRIAGTSFDKPRDVGYFSNVSYSYSDRYSATFSYRVDESNLFGVLPELRRNKLWSTGFSWHLSEEPFFNMESIDFLSFRATYGFTGNVDRNGTTELTGLSANDTNRDNARVISRPMPANISYRPEDVRTINFGIDLNAFQNRLRMILDLYHKKSSDLIALQNIDATNGFGTARINKGEMINKGIELQLGYPIWKRNNFRWDANLVFSYNKNEVTKNDIEVTGFEYPEKVVGYPIHAIWSIPYEGLDEMGNAIARGSNGERLTLDAFGDNPPQDSWVFSGQYDPKYFGSLGNTFSYKNASLHIDLTYKGGHKYSPPAAEFISDPFSDAPGSFAVNRWRKPGDEANTDIPTYNDDFSFGNTFAYYISADTRVEDATHIRVRNINLSYRVPKQVFGKSGLGNLTITAQMENPFLWTKSDKDFDPDYIPQRRHFSIAERQNGYAIRTVRFGLRLDY